MKADKKGTVLIVDDEAANLGVLFEHLRQADFKVLAAEDGESALRGISRVIPDIALLDVKLPDIDGFELCRRLKERCKDIPVIFMTSLTDIQGRLRGLDLSAVDYITKPFYPEEVVVRVTKHLMLKNLRKSLQEKNVQLEHEIAERKRVEEELIRSKEAAEAANKAKSTFLANMSHELRTPLNAILGYAQFLQKDPAVTEHQQDRLKIIHKSGEHLLSLINDILYLSKIEAGKIELSSAQFSMTDFLNNIADIFQMRANQKGIGFRYEPSPYLPKYIRGDEVRIRQILINLLGNAVKFTDKGSITFGADYRDGRVCFEVRDTGPGISPDEREKIFDPFHQTGSSMKKSEGTGLGLSISKRLTELMGGSLTVKSTPGQGSVFRAELELPSVIPEENISDVKNSSLITGYEGARRKILIVDDIYQNRFLLSDLLISLGFETSEADDGQKAVEKAAELQPDLILMDLFMPDMDGFEAVKIIRKSESEKCQVDSGKCQVLSVKEKDNLNTFHLTHNTFHITHNTLTHNTVIIAVSAGAFEDHILKSREAGCDDFISKPVAFEELLTKMRTYLNLEWTYQKAAESAESAEPIIAPCRQDWESLTNLAKMGDVQGIRHIAEALMYKDKQLAPFAEELIRLVKGFQMGKIRIFLKAVQSEKCKMQNDNNFSL